MQIIIRNNTQNIDETFIYSYLPDYIYKLFINTVDKNRLTEFDEFFEIDSLSILERILKNLLILKTGNSVYTIKTNKNLKDSDKISLVSWLQIITYGNREIKGYSIVLDIFKYISEHIWDIYEEWLDGS